jgi:hypothetical protein
MALFRGYHEGSPFQELTDGGHFENLGIYELIRRRVRLILVCDGAQDPDFQFEDLQTALRRIGQDFGARIEFHTDHPIEALMPKSADHAYPHGLTLAERGFAVATIRYARDFAAPDVVRPDARQSVLIYLKTTMVEALPLELLGYKSRSPDFPDEPTADQFFDDDQFEAYRVLGYRIATAMIARLRLADVLEKIQLARRAP